MRKLLLAALTLISTNIYAGFETEELHKLFPNVKCSFIPSQYEQILMTTLRDKTTTMKEYRAASHRISALLVNKVVECLPNQNKEIKTPLVPFQGRILPQRVELVSIMRSGDALLECFMEHFPEASVSKVLIQRDESDATPHFKYMKLSPTIAHKASVIITEPMIATGGTLDTVLTLLKRKGVEEENIVIASVCVAPEGLAFIRDKYPRVQIVLNVLDERLNERKYILPGLGDFGDRYFGTEEG